MPEVIHLFSEQDSKGSLLAEVHSLQSSLAAMRKARDFHGANSAEFMRERDRLREQIATKLEGKIVEGERKAYQYVLDERKRAIVMLQEQVRVLRVALLKARAKMTHSIGCASVLPTGIWAERESINFDDCKCEIAIVDAALAAPEPRP